MNVYDMCICLFFPSFSDSLVDSCMDSFKTCHLPIHSCIQSVTHLLHCPYIHNHSHHYSCTLGTRSPGGHQAVLATSGISQVLNSSLALCISPVAMTVDNLACENCGKSWGRCLREEFWPFFVCQCFVVSNAFRWFGVLKLESSRS